jgi:hypothetical protein
MMGWQQLLGCPLKGCHLVVDCHSLIGCHEP